MVKVTVKRSSMKKATNTKGKTKIGKITGKKTTKTSIFKRRKQKNV